MNGWIISYIRTMNEYYIDKRKLRFSSSCNLAEFKFCSDRTVKTLKLPLDRAFNL